MILNLRTDAKYHNLALSDLTKKELLEFIFKHGYHFPVTDRDIIRIRWDSMTRKAQAMMDEACQEIKRYKGLEDYLKWKAAHEKFDRASKLYDKANTLYEDLIT